MALSGPLQKMSVRLEDPVHYGLPVGPEILDLNPLLGKSLQLEFHGEVECLACGRLGKRSYSQGYCFPCSQRLARCDLCMVKPERCHYHRGTCREPEWGQSHCLKEHVVYLANASGLKVGITRAAQIPVRWIDQGALQALPVFRVGERLHAGLLETVCKGHVADRTDWRRMLRGDTAPLDLPACRDQLLAGAAGQLAELREQVGAQALQPLTEADAVTISYPLSAPPPLMKSLSLDRLGQLEAQLLGIKGQYLVLSCGVLNVRKHAGYRITLRWQ